MKIVYKIKFHPTISIKPPIVKFAPNRDTIINGTFRNFCNHRMCQKKEKKRNRADQKKNAGCRRRLAALCGFASAEWRARRSRWSASAGVRACAIDGAPAILIGRAGKKRARSAPSRRAACRDWFSLSATGLRRWINADRSLLGSSDAHGCPAGTFASPCDAAARICASTFLGPLSPHSARDFSTIKKFVYSGCLQFDLFFAPEGQWFVMVFEWLASARPARRAL